MKYWVSWDIGLEADSFEEAAELVRKIHQDPESISTAFDVTGENGETCRIDFRGNHD